MLSRRGTAVVVVLFMLAVFLTGQARLVLDGITGAFRNDFQEMLYMPRGNGLKVLACGFDAPLADALFIKSMIYFGESLVSERTAQEGSKYTYELFDVITDLSPRFYRSYEVGSIFLTSSASLVANEQGRDLLLKGIDTFDEIAAGGERIRMDPRWLFHVLLANIYDVNIQPKLRRAGDMDGATEARLEAAKHFRLGASSPRAPAYVLAAATGYERLNSGNGDIVVGSAAMMSVWVDLAEQAAARGDKDLAAELESRVEAMGQYLSSIVETRRLQEDLSEAGRRYLAQKGTLPRGVADLRKSGFIADRPFQYPLDRMAEDDDTNGDVDDDSGDFSWVLPDGSFRSNKLALIEADSQLNQLANAILLYRRANQKPPETMEDLLRENFLSALPEPPLAALGQEYLFDPETGGLEILMPPNPLLPPELR